MLKRIEAKDEFGRQWIVFDGDPAWRSCKELQHVGLTEIVLPMEVLRGGLSGCPELLPVNSMPTWRIRQSPEIRLALQLAIRLRDCVAYLKRQQNNERVYLKPANTCVMTEAASLSSEGIT